MSYPSLSAADSAFAAALGQAARGPDRDGVFALWLLVRAALGSAAPATSAAAGAARPGSAAPPAPPSPAPPPARQAERLKALSQRLRSLNTPAPLRRSLAAATLDLQPARATPAAIVLQQLVAPAAECHGRKVADAVAAAARAARAGTRASLSPST